MMIKDFDFGSIHAVRKQCWTYKSDGNTPIKKGKNLYPLEVITKCDALKGFFVEIVKHYYSDSAYHVWNDLGNSCIVYGAFHPRTDICETRQIINSLCPYKGIEGFRENLSLSENCHEWIRLSEIMALADNGDVKLAEHYRRYHDKLKAEREEEERSRREKYGRQEQERERKRQEEIAAQVDHIEQNIKNKKDFKNELIDGKSIVLILMERYGIKVPIRTQGWFNQKLAFVKWIDGEITYSYYKTKGTNGSQTAFKYLYMLEDAVNAE